LIEAVGPASLLVVIKSRMSAKLCRQTTAEDILQEALLRAWRSRDGLEWRGASRWPTRRAEGLTALGGDFTAGPPAFPS
jgi:hypothetical protein